MSWDRLRRLRGECDEKNRPDRDWSPCVGLSACSRRARAGGQRKFRHYGFYRLVGFVRGVSVLHNGHQRAFGRTPTYAADMGAYYDGNNLVQSFVSQTISTVPNQEYTISFLYGEHNDNPSVCGGVCYLDPGNVTSSTDPSPNQWAQNNSLNVTFGGISVFSASNFFTSNNPSPTNPDSGLSQYRLLLSDRVVLRGRLQHIDRADVHRRRLPAERDPDRRRSPRTRQPGAPRIGLRRTGLHAPPPRLIWRAASVR